MSDYEYDFIDHEEDLSKEEYLKKVDELFAAYPAPIGKVILMLLGLFCLFAGYFWIWTQILGK